MYKQINTSSDNTKLGLFLLTAYKYDPRGLFYYLVISGGKQWSALTSSAASCSFHQGLRACPAQLNPGTILPLKLLLSG